MRISEKKTFKQMKTFVDFATRMKKLAGFVQRISSLSTAFQFFLLTPFNQTLLFHVASARSEIVIEA